MDMNHPPESLPAPVKFNPGDWLFTVALKKALPPGIKALTSWVLAHKYAALLTPFFIALGLPADPATIQVAIEALATAGGTSALAFVRNWLKGKTALGAKLL